MNKVRITLWLSLFFGLVGTVLLNHAILSKNGEVIISLEWAQFIIPASMIYWSLVGYSIRKENSGIFMGITWGFVSPFIGAFITGLPCFIIGAIPAVLIAYSYYYVTVPIGIVTGLSIWFINRTAFDIDEIA